MMSCQISLLGFSAELQTYACFSALQRKQFDQTHTIKPRGLLFACVIFFGHHKIDMDPHNHWVGLRKMVETTRSSFSGSKQDRLEDWSIESIDPGLFSRL